MKNKNNENEYIGIIAIITIIILAVVVLYYFFSHPSTVNNGTDLTKIPLEAPEPIHDKTN